MRKRFLLSLLVALLTTLSTHAYDFQSGDLYYNITSDTTVEVTYQVYGSESNYQGLTTATIPETVTSDGTTYSVTSIGNEAFRYCTSLTSITLPNSVTSIGTWAFTNCSSLTSITIPNSVTSIGWGAFSICTSLTSITIPNAVTSIGDYAFYDCSSLTSITIGNSVTNIGSSAFEGCSSLTSITIPNSVTSIGWGAFAGCSSLTSIVVESGNTVYDSRDNCNAIIETATNTLIAGCQSTTIPNSVTSIGDYAFSGCSSLTSITIPNSVTSIGEGAFKGCSSLTSITIPNSVTSIGDYAFSDCTSLPVEDNLRYADTYLVEAVDKSLSTYTIKAETKWIGTWAFRDCSSLTSITLPNSVTSIGAYAFWSCSSLTSIILPNSVISIGYSAFNGCSSLTSITIPNSVTSIGGIAFWSCSSLTSITLPNSVTSIGDYAFCDCSALTSVTSLSCTPPSCGRNVFYYTPSEKTLVVPSISMDAYKNSSTWETFTSFESIVYPSITLHSSDSTLGIAQIDQDVDCDSIAIISATVNRLGYHFTQWSDGNTDNPRTITLTQDTTFTAEFAPNQYTLTTTTNYAERGTVQGDTIADYLTELQVSATANYGYHFTQWGDGNTDNPRTIKLTQDTTFVAEFEMDYSGKCGDELYWTYSNQEIKITGTGAMYNYTDSTMPWTLLRDSILTVRVGNNATSIGEYAFANTRKLAELQIGTGVEDIGANAFAGCNRIYHIYCYPTYPPFADESSFANYNVYLHIPCEKKEGYTLDLAWGKFKFIECIGSEDVEVSGNEVNVSPDYEDATFTWPVTDNADTYSLVITKDGVTFCTLVFNAQGQLVSIAFKPRRQNVPAAEGTTPATYAEMTANGFRFTVTGLDEGAAYAYTLTVRNADNTVLETYTGDFITLSNTPTGISDSPDATETVLDKGAEKLLRDGQVLILRNGVTYDVMGQTR